MNFQQDLLHEQQPSPEVEFGDINLDEEDPRLDEEDLQDNASSGQNTIDTLGYLFDANFEPQIPDLKLSVSFIWMLRNATLENSGLDSHSIYRLCNPATEPLQIDDPNEIYSLKQYIAAQHSSQNTYRTFQRNHNSHFPEFPMLSYEQIQKRLETWTGITPIMTAQCRNTCMAYTGPLKDLEYCKDCHESRWDMSTIENLGCQKKIPACEFLTIPLGPLIQALFHSPEMAKEMLYLQERLLEIHRLLDAGETITEYDDIVTGWEFLEAAERGDLQPHDIVFMESMDGAQLYRDKVSDCWIIIYILFVISPTKHYKKRLVLPGGIIGGPNAPKHVESFLFVGLSHISALQKEGLKIWNAANNSIYLSQLLYWLTSADGPRSIHMSGTVGHMGACPCRLFCGLMGRHKPGHSHHYLALLKPNDYSVDKCDYPDLNPNDIHGASPIDYS